MARTVLESSVTMAARKRRATDAVRTAGSWMALLAATTLGTDVAAEAVHAEVRVESPALLAGAKAGKAGKLGKGQAFRLIVQSYDARDTDLEALKSGTGRAKPVGSMQRVVSAEELANGIRVDFVELREQSEQAKTDGKTPLVVAWLESTRGDYDLDAREARPRAGSLLGIARRVARDVKIRLDRVA